MKQYSPDHIRNVVLLSHSGAGKTTLSEALLFAAGTINRLGKIEAGNTTSDYDPDEIKHRISINLSLLPFEWHESKVNLLDTPGYLDFVGEVKAAIRVSEGALILASAASGLEVGTELAWNYSQEAGQSQIIFINKMDRENANFNKTVEQSQSRFGSKCIPLQMPIGAHTGFKGIIDLISMKAYAGNPPQEAAVPAELVEQAKALQSKMIEAVAETDDALMEKYLGGEELSAAEIIKGLQQAVSAGKIVPILTGSGLQGIGVTQLLDAIERYLPSPLQRKIAVAEDSSVKDLQPDVTGMPAALVFKTTADPYVGKLTYFRVYSGTIESNSHIWNVNQNADERIGQLFMVRGKTQESMAKVEAGDIGGVAKLNITLTGDTLGTQAKPAKLAPLTFPKPIYSVAVHPKTKADLDKMGSALARLAEEDLTLHIRRDHDTAETILSGMGDTQLAVAGEKMQRKFGVGVELTPPKVPYRESITQAARSEFRHKKQSGGHGQFGHVVLELEPLPRGSANVFENKVVGGAVPKNYIPAVEKGVLEASKEGSLAGFPVVGLKAIIVDGSFHPVDSSEMCFKIAGAGALKQGMQDAKPILLEPMVSMKITVPNDFTGDILSDLNTKRAHVMGMNPEGGINVIDAEAPMAEVLRYATDLKSITQGRGTYTMEFKQYKEVPAHITQKIIADRQAEKEQEALK
ncbi:MAG: elongation factor G [Dehalococcoidia bacterium]|nr:MAG: elongation factor G [Dehalococcoidia bacterium]